MTRDTLRCAACDVPGRIFEPLPGMPMFGHVRQPDPIHAFRLAPASRSGPAPAIFEDGGNPGRSEVPVRSRSRGATALAVPDPSQPTARARAHVSTVGLTPLPSGQGRRAAASPRGGSDPAPRASTLSAG